MSKIDFFKNEAKKFLKDWKTQTTITNDDGSVSYHYDWKFYNLNYYFTFFKLDDKDRQEIKLARAQHYLAKIIGCKNWNGLLALPDIGLEKAKEIIRERNEKIAIKEKYKQSLICIRLRCHNELTPEDEALFNAAFNNILTMIKKSITDTEFWADHFELWDTQDDSGRIFIGDDRRKYLERKLKNKKISYAKVVTKCYTVFKDTRPHIGLYSPVSITQLLGQLDIRVFKVNLGTDKISGFCTRLFDINLDSEIPDVVIVINELYCNTPEKFLHELAKQFYYMIAKTDEFDYGYTNIIKMEMASTQNEAEKFADELFIPTDTLNYYLEHYSLAGAMFNYELTRDDKEYFLAKFEFDNFVNEIKKDFRVSYKTAIKRLFESNWKYKFMFNSIEEMEKNYFQCLKRHDEKFADKISYLNGEPAPLPWKVIGFDASERYR